MEILDSGERREFSTGAVRDIQEGKGRFDLVPLEVVVGILRCDRIIYSISLFLKTNKTCHLYNALRAFSEVAFENSLETMLLEVAIQFENGAKKYGENNWQKGLPTSCYMDSAVRHYLKYRRGDNDEPHNLAFVWNLMCCIWEVDHHNSEV
jgi:hypothetical protein